VQHLRDNIEVAVATVVLLVLVTLLLLLKYETVTALIRKALSKIGF